ncbi:MAG TPA: 23S rRNA (adenine(2503)-C(2))-methyltransferase RlmN [Proteobacteria bacterium]|nr:23S rRNA (adenine(2503)-C(2))-methyltransferase RlmN [Pseudomonadota bacterium]
MTRQELADYLTAIGKERFRADQIIRWLYRQRVSEIALMTNLSRACREYLEASSYISTLTCLREQVAEDGTRKYLFQLEDGQTIETVLIGEKERLTICLSTQVGCRMGCRFCLTGQSGFCRQLSSAEIVDQVIQVIGRIDPEAPARGVITNLVLMGMGEPLDNLEGVIRALEIMMYDDGLQFSSRRITLSTCGLAPQIEELGRRIEVSLAVSLNATTDELRARLMPVNRRYDLKTLLTACRDYPLNRRRRITFEYILFADLNDSLADARRLADLVAPLSAKINLIPFNEHPELPFKKPRPEKIEEFLNCLQKRNLTVMTRRSKGADISAACGQLRGETLSANDLL